MNYTVGPQYKKHPILEHLYLRYGHQIRLAKGWVGKWLPKPYKSPVLCHLSFVYMFVVCSLLSSVPFCRRFPFVVCSLLSFVPFCRLFHFVVCSFLSFVPFCWLFPFAVHALLSSVPFCRLLTFVMVFEIHLI